MKYIGTLEQLEAGLAVTVTASSGEGERAASTDFVVNVSIANTAPRFAEGTPTQVALTETQFAGSPPGGVNVGSPFQATDDENDEVTYSLTGRDPNKFQIGADGQLVYIGTEDDLKESLSVTVRASSGEGERLKTTDHVVTVTLGNTAPKFAEGTPTQLPISAQEISNTAIGSVTVGAPFQASDAESEEDNPVTYSVHGRDSDKFEIDPTSGQLKYTGNVDDLKDSLSVIITATSGTDDRVQTTSHTLTVVLDNDVVAVSQFSKPSFSKTRLDGAIPVNPEIVELVGSISAGSVIARVEATGSGAVNYSLRPTLAWAEFSKNPTVASILAERSNEEIATFRSQYENSHNLFSINDATGEITLNKDLNPETLPLLDLIELQVVVRGSNGVAATKAIVFPTKLGWISRPTQLNVGSDTKPGDSVGWVKAKSFENDDASLSYSMSSDGGLRDRL
ncbi:putative protocadherin Fat 1 [Roseibium sp. TrichSKD4]|uniref:cadherin repeat domain-containing protein n=1 Tax=Roseibium sp. TrichSKD4 TaxID=744980 RepID=UPI0001E57729|nr:cadherin repeat domain-containing protein [Roseibium sp. TrichSKD4]EFO28592.1 putative protocadherin Fat 1 [Roseibium sp. TrichSKD4]